MNWWVVEVSDEIHWDVDGLSIIDPRQVAHILDLLEAMRDYNFEQDFFESAFIPFRIQKDLGNGFIRLVRAKEGLIDAEEPMFALPDVVDDENSPYADFLSHITKVRVKMLNDLIDFEQKLTVDEVEDSIREEENNSFIEGKAVHLFNEVCAILDYVPAGWELDEDGDVAVEGEEIEGFADIEEEDTAQLDKDESLKWDDDEEEKSDEVEYEGGPPDDKAVVEEDFEDEEEEEDDEDEDEDEEDEDEEEDEEDDKDR